MKKQTLRIVLLVVIMAIALSACGNAAAQATTNLTVTMTDFEFNPTSSTVPAGETITLKLINNGAVAHEWALLSSPVEIPFDDEDEAKILFEAEVEAGESATVTFTAPAAAGEYEVVCAIPGHLEAGMIGKLIVVQP